ncbi:MAG: iron-containing alcohol dehydrogenase [Clostridium sp.]|jgi:alcohol dehydrogenase YqhD (iron-dependent ADH family)|nr:iron-containing alcohol dehydrogenase [Clostridium sp.]
MNNFRYYAPTDIRFGKNQVERLPELLAPYGRKVLLVYGGGSIRRIGLYDKVKELLRDFEVSELPGVEPNPRIASVRRGVAICKEKQIDAVLAVGGGSAIDAAKVIAGGACYAGDPWELVQDGRKVGRVLPIVTVLTLAATGTEMNRNAVISNPETNEKLGTAAPDFIPKASVCDPAYLYSLPPYQTAAGTADIMSHLFEQYFQADTGAYLSDRFAEGVLKACLRYCPIALKEPDNYEARANLMWASTQALNGLTSCGKGGAWTCHPIEHELSAYYDVTHGAGLAIVTPSWMRYILHDDTVGKFCEYARNVWNITEQDPYQCAKQAIDSTEAFFWECGLPKSLTELGIDDSKFETMAKKAVRFGGLAGAYVPLKEKDVVAILKMCL